MKSIKPGRGPSFISGIICIFAGIFGVIWIVAVAAMGGGLFCLFGLIFVAIAVVQAVFNFKNATSKNRYSVYDITDHNEEPDPLNERFGNFPEKERTESVAENKFCPYCGNAVEEEFEFCNACGKKLP